jgi:hypothetical protein
MKENTMIVCIVGLVVAFALFGTMIGATYYRHENECKLECAAKTGDPQGCYVLFVSQ